MGIARPWLFRHHLVFLSPNYLLKVLEETFYNKDTFYYITVPLLM